MDRWEGMIHLEINHVGISLLIRIICILRTCKLPFGKVILMATSITSNNSAEDSAYVTYQLTWRYSTFNCHTIELLLYHGYFVAIDCEKS